LMIPDQLSSAASGLDGLKRSDTATVITSAIFIDQYRAQINAGVISGLPAGGARVSGSMFR